MKAAKKSIKIVLVISFETSVTIASDANESTTCSALLVSLSNHQRLHPTYLQLLIVYLFVSVKIIFSHAINNLCSMSELELACLQVVSGWQKSNWVVAFEYESNQLSINALAVRHHLAGNELDERTPDLGDFAQVVLHYQFAIDVLFMICNSSCDLMLRVIWSDLSDDVFLGDKWQRVSVTCKSHLKIIK